ncbi:50S ribosomal protein LX [archaeon BMS3Bbin15]|nr:50S ribosomal protein LX [archaeon BMS3Bbin15]
MEIKTFRIKGKFKMGERMQPFVWECRALDSERATEKMFSEFGSRHGTRRNMIKISSLEEIKPEDAERPEVKFYAGIED